eukprot:363599-Chlamydomonas_euryale.AAC.1
MQMARSLFLAAQVCTAAGVPQLMDPQRGVAHVARTLIGLWLSSCCLLNGWWDLVEWSAGHNPCGRIYSGYNWEKRSGLRDRFSSPVRRVEEW